MSETVVAPGWCATAVGSDMTLVEAQLESRSMTCVGYSPPTRSTVGSTISASAAPRASTAPPPSDPQESTSTDTSSAMRFMPPSSPAARARVAIPARSGSHAGRAADERAHQGPRKEAGDPRDGAEDPGEAHQPRPPLDAAVDAPCGVLSTSTMKGSGKVVL